jgi:GAF domain-containing protein
MSEKKSNRYARIELQLRDILAGCDDLLSRMSSVNAVLYHKMEGFFWVGFYLLRAGRLLVGPYQGPLACLELPKNKGVCWQGISRGETILVPDVHKFPGHIACDARSRSEIVIPVRDKSNTIIGVLDIDSNKINNFDNIDAEYLERIVVLLFS